MRWDGMVDQTLSTHQRISGETKNHKKQTLLTNTNRKGRNMKRRTKYHKASDFLTIK